MLASRAPRAAIVVALGCLTLSTLAPAGAYPRPSLTERISLTYDGTEVLEEGGSGQVAISADGRAAAFMSVSQLIIEDDFNPYPDVFVRDLTTGAVERISEAP